MKGKIILSKESIDIYKYNIEMDAICEYDYIITINTDLDETFIELISNYHALDESIDFSIDFAKTSDLEFAEEDLQFYEECKRKKLELLQNAEYVEFDYEIDKVIEYIKKNPILRTKKIILKDNIVLNAKTLDKIKDNLGNVDNLYFKLSNNDKLISFDECYETFEALEKIANEIKKFNFSPLETIMYVYDIVRNKLYQKEAANEAYEESRDLTSSLLGDKIVCLGYARIFSSLLEKLGIESKECYLYGIIDGKQEGHARNEIYIKDDKYNVDGVYYFDATWDRKRAKEDNSYLSSYKYFAKTKSEMDSIDDGQIIDRDFKYFSQDIAYEFEEILETEGLEKVPKKIIKAINYMSHKIKDKVLIHPLALIPKTPFYGRIDRDKVFQELEEIVEYFNRPLYADTLLTVLYNVRKIQYYIDPIKYPFDVNDFYKIVVLSDWHFEPSNEEKLIEAITGKRNNTNRKNRMIQHINETDLSRQIGQIKLTRTLRTIHNRNKQV